MAVTAKDIARVLELSQPTVSRILSNTPGLRVSAETRERVLKCAREMGYRPNAIARSLKRQRTNILGFYSGYARLDVQNQFLGAIIGGLQEAGEAHGFDLLLHGVQPHRSPETIMMELLDGRIDGLFLHARSDDPLIQQLRESALTVVSVVDELPGIPTVTADNRAGMKALLDLLWSRGHRHIAFLEPAIEFASVRARSDAFQEEMNRRAADGGKGETIRMLWDQTDQAWDTLRNREDRPTAVCCWNDRGGYDLLWRCMQAGVKVPEELAIVGFDGFAPGLLPLRTLTTAAVPYRELTAQAMAMMTSLLAGNAAHALPPLPVEIVLGDTI